MRNKTKLNQERLGDYSLHLTWSFYPACRVSRRLAHCLEGTLQEKKQKSDPSVAYPKQGNVGFSPTMIMGSMCIIKSTVRLQLPTEQNSKITVEKLDWNCYLDLMHNYFLQTALRHSLFLKTREVSLFLTFLPFTSILWTFGFLMVWFWKKPPGSA